MKHKSCPQGQTLLDQVFENEDISILEKHRENCVHCKADTEMSDILMSWQKLDVLEDIQVSQNFEARLFTQLEAQPKHEMPAWLQWMDGWFEIMHIPALAILVALFFWFPLQSQPAENLVLKRPPIENKPLKESVKIPVQKALELLRDIYSQRRNEG